jgi:hypothetical protein
MKILVICILALVGVCHAEDAALLTISKLLNPGQIIRIDCYMGDRLTEEKDISKIGKYLIEESKFRSIDDNSLLIEVSNIFNRRAFAKKRLLISPKLRIYNMFVFVFADKSELALINSSGFGVDQFVVGEILGKPRAREIREIEISIRGDKGQETVSLSLPGFQDSAFLRQVVTAK